MSGHYLDQLCNPSSIAVIGASERTHSVGMRVFNNLLKGGFAGKIYPVNNQHPLIQGQQAYASVLDIPDSIDLAVITTPSQTVPQLITECGKKGIKSVIIISAGFSETGVDGKALEQAFLAEAEKYKIRLIGPNCLGMMRPHLKLNATFDNNTAIPGHIALVSQSGAICAAILDWAIDKQIGFSAMISIGNAADLDFGEILDFLALDTKTKSILLYVEGIHHARRFMSGLRAASRMKPVVVIKAGRHTQGSRAAHSHTGALVGDDDAFDAALHRAGVVRVMTIEQLFSAAEILSTNYRANGNRLAIITNGGGAGVMAADRASELKVDLEVLDADTTTQLNQVLPATWSHQNPIDIIGDATPKRYHDALDVCSRAKNIDGILTILIPVAMSDPLNVAKQIVDDARSHNKPVIACWMGQHQVKSSWDYFAKNGIPCFRTPEGAIEAFSYLAEHHENQKLLLQVPESFTLQPKPDIEKAKNIIKNALADNRNTLTTSESKTILKAFGIPVTETIICNSEDDAVNAAETLQFPVVMKINSPDITHKSDVNGVQLDINNTESVRSTYKRMLDNAKRLRPDARITGVTIEKMYPTINNRELMIGVIRDNVFGPVITFGMGGTLVEIIQDRAVALPPLNTLIIHNLIARTRAATLLEPFRHMPAANLDAIVHTLLRVSDMVCELPYIKEMDINPLIANDKEVMSVDARIVIEPVPASFIPYQHMAICPYPAHLMTTWQTADGLTITIRPIKPEDAKIEQDFVRHLSAKSKYFRFMEHLQELTLDMLVKFTQIDYDREMALIATYENKGQEVHIGVARYIINPDQQTCEFALVVTDEWQNKGIGTKLMTSLITIAKSYGVSVMTGEILSNNKPMLSLVEHLGFNVSTSDIPDILVVSKALNNIINE